MKFITPDYITLIIRRTGMPVTQHAQKSPSQQPLSENHLLPVYGVAEIFNTDAAHTIFLHRIVKMRTYRLHGYPQPVCQKGKPVVMENNPEDHHHLCPVSGLAVCPNSHAPRRMVCLISVRHLTEETGMTRNRRPQNIEYVSLSRLRSQRIT